MKKTGILGGTFNPIHRAHLVMAEAALGQGQMDEVWFMPSKNPPHKSRRELVSEAHRSRMIQLAIEEMPSCFFSDFELRRRGTTYTADTLQLLKREYPDRIFFFILGGDSLFTLEDWYRPEVIMKTCSIMAVSRDGTTDRQMQERAGELEARYQADIRILQMEDLAVSSSKIRARIGRGLAVAGLVPEKVAQYIEQHMLYR